MRASLYPGDTKPMTTQLEQCEAYVDEPPHYLRTHQCSRRSTTDRLGGQAPSPLSAPVHLYLCAQHARMVDRWGAHLLTEWARAARGSS